VDDRIRTRTDAITEIRPLAAIPISRRVGDGRYEKETGERTSLGKKGQITERSKA
jgi:hypothetical protein